MKLDKCPRNESEESVEMARYNDAILEDPFFNKIFANSVHNSENLYQATVDHLLENVQ